MPLFLPQFLRGTQPAKAHHRVHLRMRGRHRCQARQSPRNIPLSYFSLCSDVSVPYPTDNRFRPLAVPLYRVNHQ